MTALRSRRLHTRGWGTVLVGVVTLTGYVRQTGNTDSRRFTACQTKMERAQAALPTSLAAMSVIVGETASPPVSALLANLGSIRHEIGGAL